MSLFAVSPALVAVALVWWGLGAGWGIVLLLVLVIGGAAVVVRKR